MAAFQYPENSSRRNLERARLTYLAGLNVCLMRTLNESLRPTKESVSLISHAISSIRPDDHALDEWITRYGAGQSIRLAYDVDLIRQFVPISHSILEVGSIPLFLTSALQESGYCVEGVDIEPHRFSKAIASHGFTVHAANVETDRLPIADAAVDCVIFNEIFEHLRINIIYTLSELIRVIKPGGIIMLSTPNLRSLKNLYGLAVKNYVFSIHGPYAKLATLGHMGHVRLYTSKEVGEFLRTMGLETEATIFRGAYSPQSWKRLIWNIAAPFKPIFSIIARKPAAKSPPPQRMQD